MSRARHDLTSERLVAYLEQEVTASGAESIEAALADAPEAKRRLAELERLRSALREPPFDLDEVNLVTRVRQGLLSPPVPRRRRRLGRWAALAATGVVALGAVLLGLPRRDEFRVKGAAPTASEEKRWAGVTAYHVDHSGVPHALGATLPAHDGLVFSYTNLGSRPFGYLMIFGIDMTGEVRWFHPAYEEAGTNPTSIAILPGQARRALGELVVHDLPAGSFTLHALFTRAPLRVRDVETLVKEGGQTALDALPNSSNEVWTTQVTP